MTRLWTTGYETGDVAESGVSTVGAAQTLTVVGSTPTPRAGSYCLKLAAAAGAFNTVTSKAFAFGSNKTDVWLRFAFYVHGLPSGSEGTIVLWNDSAGSAQCSLGFWPSDGLLRVHRGGSTATTVIATASAALTQDAWHAIEMRYQITSATVGIVEVWLDGTRVVNFSGDAAATANVNVLSVLLGALFTASASTGMTGVYYAFDDIAINDTAGSVNNGRAGDGRVVLLSPTGAGSNSGLTRGGTDTGANWSQTSELPPSLTQYVFGATAALRDTYALGDLPVTPASISAVEVIALAQNNDAGAGSLGLTVKSSSTTNEGTAQALGTSAAYLRQLYETDPATSTAWTAAGVNALEAGVTVR